MRTILFRISFVAIICCVKVTSAECEDNEECVSLFECKDAMARSVDPRKICSVLGPTKICCENSSIETKTMPSTERKTMPSIETRAMPSVCTVNDHPNLKLINFITCGSSEADRIFGGEEAAKYEFPWLGLLKFRSTDDENFESFMCGGTLISPRYVLTAAHCFRDAKYKLFSVRFGEHKISDIHDSIIEDISIDKTIIHKDYDNVKKINDIALVRLARDVQITRDTFHVKTICLPVNETHNIDNFEGEFLKLTIAGWGKTEHSELSSDVLMKAVVDYLPHDICAENFVELRKKHSMVNVEIKDTHLCAGGTNKVDTCKGDSGSAIQGFAKNGKGTYRMFQQGVVSIGFNCGRSGAAPGVYARVSEFMCWILDNMQQ